MNASISLIVAMDKNGLIGNGQYLPWHLPDDMKHFRSVTMGKPVIMGRKTYETIPERFRPLAGRHNIILTQQTQYNAPGCTIVHSVEEALHVAKDSDEIMVIGGAMIYEQFLPLASRIYLTEVDGQFEGDIYFPSTNWKAWNEVKCIHHGSDHKHSHSFTFKDMERKTDERSPKEMG